MSMPLRPVHAFIWTREFSTMIVGELCPFYFRLGCLTFRLYVCTGLDLAVRLLCTGLGLALGLGVGLGLWLCSRLLCGRIL